MASLLRDLTLWCAMFLCAGHAMAADTHPSHPDQPIKTLVPFAAGSALDTAAGLIAEEARATFGTIAVENKAGANGILGASTAAKAKADGLTLALTSSSRAAEFPAVQTLQASGYGDFDIVVRVGLAAPAGTPGAVAQAWNDQLRRALALPRVAERVGALDMAPAPNALTEHSRFAPDQHAACTQCAAQARL